MSHPHHASSAQTAEATPRAARLHPPVAGADDEEEEETPATTTMSDRPLIRILKHLCHCLALFATLTVFIFVQGGLRLTLWDPRLSDIHPVHVYGVVGAFLLYAVRTLALLSAPQLIFNFVGLVFYNVFPPAVKLKGSPLLAPLICFRVVTRGDYPDLVRTNVIKNVNTVIDVGLENYMIEVVTDKPIELPSRRRIREIVVPKSYQTKSGALFKARALHYCLEDSVNELNDHDWIVHLDEETLLTPNCVRGILNFVSEGKHQFGQGLITYANNGAVVNWITTLADSIRVSDDMGKLRLQFRACHKPLFSFKGSFVVSKVAAERDIGFDNGIDGSIAEDCFFAMLASSRGYTFDFIEGEMHEKSPFTLMDFIQQRKRWLQGLLLVVHAKEIPCRTKIWLATGVYSTATLPLTLSNIIWAILFPIPMPLPVDLLFAFLGGMALYMYIFGVVKSFSLSSRAGGWLKTPFCVVCVVLLVPVFIVLETIAVVWGWVGKKHKFHVVQKNTSDATSATPLFV